MAVVLVIDDSDAHRAEIRAALEKSGVFATILEASDGLRGLKILLGEPVDLVLCDLEMPGLDGEKLLRVKSQSPGGDNIPFIFLTAKADEQSRQKGMRTGVDDYIIKPFDIEQLLSRINRLLERTKIFQEQLDARIGQDFSRKLMPKTLPQVVYIKTKIELC